MKRSTLFLNDRQTIDTFFKRDRHFSERSKKRSTLVHTVIETDKFLRRKILLWLKTSSTQVLRDCCDCFQKRCDCCDCFFKYNQNLRLWDWLYEYVKSSFFKDFKLTSSTNEVRFKVLNIQTKQVQFPFVIWLQVRFLWKQVWRTWQSLVSTF